MNDILLVTLIIGFFFTMLIFSMIKRWLPRTEVIAKITTCTFLTLVLFLLLGLPAIIFKTIGVISLILLFVGLQYLVISAPFEDMQTLFKNRLER